MIWNLRVKAPTGSDPYGVKMQEIKKNGNLLAVPTDLPSGKGLWAASTGFSFVKTLDPAIVFASINYFHNFSGHFDDISSTAGTIQPGDVKLGDSIQYGIGTAFALNERMSISMSFTQRLTAKSEIQYDSHAWQKKPDSDAILLLPPAVGSDLSSCQYQHIQTYPRISRVSFCDRAPSPPTLFCNP